MKRYAYVFILILIAGVSCEKFLDVGNPQDMIAAAYVYESNTSAAAAMTSVYYDLVQKGGFTQGISGISIGCGAAADELDVFPNTVLREFYTNTVSVGSGGGYWSSLYKSIYRANAVIEGLKNGKSLSSKVRQHLIGEAKFVRAFCYFYLVNLYGNVPILTSPDYRENQDKERQPSSIVYDQILNDLRESEQFLSEDYLNADVLSVTTERLRPNKWVAKALLARVYLYLGNWVNAVEKSNEIIQRNDLFDTVPLNDVFVRNSKESIWQLQSSYNNPDANYWGTFDGRAFILETPPNELENPVWLSRSLFATFELSDKRRSSWINVYTLGTDVYHYSFKYKQNKPDVTPSEYLTVFRLSEMYLVRGEAKARLGEINGARADLNIIRNRAGLHPVLSSDPNTIIDSILHERRVELFAEWGHRWLDLKRTGLIDKVMLKAVVDKGGVWNSNKALFPLPERDILLNPNLKQNDGY